MGLANWVVGKMVDRFLAQPPAEKAAMVDTMATKFWEAATPEETAQIAELLIPRFIETFLNGATAEQKLDLTRRMITPEHLQEHVTPMVPALLESAMKNASPEQSAQLMRSMLDRDQLGAMLGEMLPGLLQEAVKAMPQAAMQRFLGSMMPGFGSAGSRRDEDGPRPPKPPGGMMPW